MSNKKTGAKQYTDEKAKTERDDLRRVLSAVFENPEIVRNESLLGNYLSEDSTRLVADSRRVPFRKLEVITERGGLVHVGGGGVVIQCANKTQPTIKYALKIPRPSLFQGRSERVQENYQAALDEYLKHAPLSHENVARVFDTDEMAIRDKKGRKISHTVILMEWIDGATPLNKYLVKADVDYRAVVNVLTQCFSALSYIHGKSLIHWDVKSDNLLVSAAGTVKLTDIGNARRADDPNRGNKAYSTRGNLPEALVGDRVEVRIGDTSRRVQVTVPDPKWDCPWLDLWMLARELNRLFDASTDLARRDWENLSTTPGEFHNFSDEFLRGKFPGEDDDAAFAKNFIRVILLRLLHPNTPRSLKCYEAAGAVVHDMAKLLPEFGDAQSVPELQAIPQRVLRIPNVGNAPWTQRVRTIFNGPTIQRLRRHKQLGAVFYVYPGASHLRIEHVAGVLTTAAQYARALYADRSEPFWRLAVDAKDISALLLAALLHDIGHIAFGHYLEEMEGLLKGRTHVDYLLRILGRGGAWMPNDRTNDDPRLRECAERDVTSIREAIISAWGVAECESNEFLELVAEILRPTATSKESAGAAANAGAVLDPKLSKLLKVDLLHSIMDSPIDADKLDYLIRDAHHCGVHYPEGIDVDRFYQSLTTITNLSGFGEVTEADRPHASIGVTHKGILPVESILVARYQMFSCVYWHHTARAYTAMLQFLVLCYLEGANSSPDVETRLDDLLAHFREMDDETALIWLRDVVVSGLTGDRRSMLSDVAEGMLGRDRRLLYRSVFELQYRTGNALKTRETYEGLMDLSRQAAKAQSPAIYVDFCRTIRQTFAESLTRQLKNRSQRKLTFSDGEVLIDIPPAGKDQVTNVFVNTNGDIRPVEQLSPLSDAVSGTFRYWVRKPRVFLGPTARAKCLDAGLTKSQLWDACFAALRDRVVLQLELPLEQTR